MRSTRPPLLRVKDARVTFGALEVLDRINLEVGDGEFVALVGPSGCGKTTLLNIVAGLEKPSRGVVRKNELSRTFRGRKHG